MKLYLAATLSFCHSMAWVTAIQAQPTPILEEVPSVAATPLPEPLLTEVQQNEIQNAVRQEVIENNLIEDQIEEEVSQTFGWTIDLLNLLITVLIAIPILTGLGALYLRQSIIDRLVREIKRQLQDEIRQEVDTQLKGQVAEELNKQIERFNADIANRLQNLYLSAEQEKDRLIQQITALTTIESPIISADETEIVLQELGQTSPLIIQEEFASSKIKERIHTLTQQLETLESEYPQLLTANDYVNQGDAYYFDRRPDEALESYETAIAKDSTLFSAWLGKSKALRRLGRLDEAIAANERVIELSPTNHRGWFGKAFALQDLQRYTEALPLIDRAIELSPNIHYLWKHRGYLLTKLGQFAAAEPCFDRAIDLNPTSSGTFYSRAYYHAAQAQVEQAIANLKRAIELYPFFGELVKTDPDFDSLRSDERFQKLSAIVSP